MSHFTFRETLVRELCNVEITVHQSMHEHRSVRMAQSKDCVYCRTVYSRRSRTTRCCASCGAPLCFLARNCFQKFHMLNFRAEREKWLQKHAAGLSDPPLGRPKGSTNNIFINIKSIVHRNTHFIISDCSYIYSVHVLWFVTS